MRVRLLYWVIIATVMCDFVQIPIKYQVDYDQPVATIQVSDVNECATLGDNDDVNCIIWYLNGTCVGYQWIQSWLGATETQQDTGVRDFAVYLRTYTKGCTSCMDAKSAELAIADFTYQGQICPPIYSITWNQTAFFCAGPLSAQNSTLLWGDRFRNYRMSVDSKKTMYMFNRAQATMSASYTCDNWNAFIAVFDYVWYCYTKASVTYTNVTSLIENDCPNYMSNSSPVKVFNWLIPGFLCIHANGFGSIGAYRTTGTTFLYWDNTTITDELIWQSGYPQATAGDFVLVNQEDLLNLENVASITYLCCMGTPIVRS
ncbi:unnamed protein product [Bursaphelenchus okinawaensis]|uniref:Uncharacterized protein n=1 Tax=Bursaphelenchus okinawaensis TaxID=465554 RepID=A0A811JVH0_9BILA|nr:unnamed protein product [Bursaphelenchus okinawaensis]CAG9084867.1 unnamed protein product [Bursaphelenchus okinawaensis]